MKVLILKPSSLGDVVHALPTVRALRRHRPEARLHWFLNRELAPLLEGDPDVERLIPFDRQGWGRPLGWPEVWSTLRQLRQARYDVILDLQSLARTALIGWVARGGMVIGLDDPREGAPAWHDVSIPRPSWDTHAVDWLRATLGPLGLPDEPVRVEGWLPRRESVAAPLRARWHSGGQTWIALQPGARWMTKRWPVGYFAAVARELTALDPGIHVAVLGGRDDAALGAAIAGVAGPRVFDFTGKLTLPELVEWLRMTTCLVTNDTGPMHLAVAVGTPVVALFGPTAPERTGPYGRGADVLRGTAPCAPCLRDSCRQAEPLACLQSIPPARVLAAVRRHLPAR
ncbi:MAG: glycosyltransferase family 9 protein [Verrucomicrobiota bacterium]